MNDRAIHGERSFEMRRSMPILPCLARILVLFAVPAIAVAIVLTLTGNGARSGHRAVQADGHPADVGYAIRGGMLVAAARG
jgi:hypothetical protein